MAEQDTVYTYRDTNQTVVIKMEENWIMTYLILVTSAQSNSTIEPRVEQDIHSFILVAC